MLILDSDEVMYQAKLHPEQYSNTFSDEQIKRLHDAIMYVCDTAVGVNADSDLFPEDWLMKHRWGKGKKDANILPNGEKITFLKVGGRTSAIVASRQKKTSAVAGDVSDSVDDDGEDEEVKPKTNNKRKMKAVKDEDEGESEVTLTSRPKRARKQTKAQVTEKSEIESESLPTKLKPKPKPKTTKKKAKQEVENEVDNEIDETPVVEKPKAAAKGAVKADKKIPTKVEIKSESTDGRRRSGRLST